MKILSVLTYYRPHVSGLTIYVERLCRALARQGHEVTILTSRYDPALPLEEVMDGVHVVRVPVAFRVSKGVIMPTIGWRATVLTRQTDILHLHLPQFDAPGLALRGRLFGKPVVLTYHCDLQLPGGLFNRIVNKVVLGMNRVAGDLSDAVVTYTRDYGTHSPYLRRYLGEKLHIIPPPVELASCSEGDCLQFRQKHNLDGHKVIGISARLATEKGVGVLLKALPLVQEAHPDAMVLHAGPNQEILGEEEYAARLRPLLAAHQADYRMLGTLQGPELTAFYKNLDVLAIPSLNSTESFGLVQIEAMMNGKPVVASNLPGVRQPVTMTGMGDIAAIGDHHDLAQKLIAVLNNFSSDQAPQALIADAFSPLHTAAAYETLFNDLLQKQASSEAIEPAAYNRLRSLNMDRSRDLQTATEESSA